MINYQMKLLKSLDIHNILTADNAIRALTLIKETYVNGKKIDLIIADWYMPVMSGHEFMDALQMDPTLSKIPVVISSSSAEAIKIPEIYKKMITFVSKPCSKDEL